MKLVDGHILRWRCPVCREWPEGGVVQWQFCEKMSPSGKLLETPAWYHWHAPGWVKALKGGDEAREQEVEAPTSP